MYTNIPEGSVSTNLPTGRQVSPPGPINYKMCKLLNLKMDAKCKGFPKITHLQIFKFSNFQIMHLH